MYSTDGNLKPIIILKGFGFNWIFLNVKCYVRNWSDLDSNDFLIFQKTSIAHLDRCIVFIQESRSNFSAFVSLALNFYYIYIMISQGIISSPFGPVKLEKTEKGLRRLQILKESEGDTISYGFDQSLQPDVDQLQSYFEGRLQNFNIALDLREQPEFYLRIWRVLCTIPYGKTRTYSEIANFLQKPNWARAVGNASAHNPVAIVIPCHRVIGKNGRLTGYLYGKDVKRRLLQHENPGHYAHQGKLQFNLHTPSGLVM